MNSDSRNLQHLLWDIVISENKRKRKVNFSWGAELTLFFLYLPKSIAEERVRK